MNHTARGISEAVTLPSSFIVTQMSAQSNKTKHSQTITRKKGNENGEFGRNKKNEKRRNTNDFTSHSFQLSLLFRFSAHLQRCRLRSPARLLVFLLFIQRWNTEFLLLKKEEKEQIIINRQRCRRQNNVDCMLLIKNGWDFWKGLVEPTVIELVVA